MEQMNCNELRVEALRLYAQFRKKKKTLCRADFEDYIDSREGAKAYVAFLMFEENITNMYNTLDFIIKGYDNHEEFLQDYLWLTQFYQEMLLELASNIKDENNEIKSDSQEDTRESSPD